MKATGGGARSHFFPIHIFFGQDSEAFILIIYDIVIIVDRHFSATNELTICMTPSLSLRHRCHISNTINLIHPLF